MKVRPAGLALGAVGLAIGVLGVLALREATLSTHEPIEPGSRMELVIRARSEGGESGQTLREMVDALVHTCRLEVTADITGPVQDMGNGRFRAVLQPSLDETNRRQFRGCIEDWTIDHLLVDVLGLTRLARG